MDAEKIAGFSKGQQRHGPNEEVERASI